MMMKVLIVDDDATIRAILETKVREWGYEVAVAASAEEALDILKHEHQPVLLVTDWVLPGMSGVELCAKLKQEKAMSKLYIILITVKSAKEDVARGLDAGAD